MATDIAVHPPSPTGSLARRQLIRHRYRPRRLVVVVVRSISSGASRTLLCPPDERPGRRSAGHLPVLPRLCLPEPVQRPLRRHHSHPPTRPQLISDALAGKRTRLGSYKLPGGPLLSGRASIWCWVAERVGEAINILKAVSSHCNQALSASD